MAIPRHPEWRGLAEQFASNDTCYHMMAKQNPLAQTDITNTHTHKRTDKHRQTLITEGFRGGAQGLRITQDAQVH